MMKLLAFLCTISLLTYMTFTSWPRPMPYKAVNRRIGKGRVDVLRDTIRIRDTVIKTDTVIIRNEPAPVIPKYPEYYQEYATDSFIAKEWLSKLGIDTTGLRQCTVEDSVHERNRIRKMITEEQ